MNVITVPEKKMKRCCPDCSGEMYKLKDSFSTIYICKECGSSIEPEMIQKYHDEENQKMPADDKIECGSNKLSSLFNSNFMKKYTVYENFTEFIKASGLVPKNTTEVTYELFKMIPRKKLDKYIKINTDFKCWNEMFDLATGKYLRIEF